MTAHKTILFAAPLSLAAVLSGAITAYLHGVGLALIGLNLAAWLAGLWAALLLARLRPGAALPLALLGTLALAATLHAPGMEGVHRWLGVGSFRINAAEALLPLTLVLLCVLRSAARLLLPAAIAALLACQPDASQATAFAAGALPALLVSKHSVVLRSLTALVLVTAAIFTWLLPDPLAPVPEVEGIVALAAQSAPLLAAAAVLSLAGVVVLFAWQARPPASSSTRAAALCLAVYFALSALAPLFGAFPVPLVGIGLSPILGFWLGLGGLLSLKTAAA